MESIRQGWLIKSPPEKRSQGRWKLFRAKWRRRYFVLYAPPAVDIIPGMCTAVLDYYGGKNLRHKHGTIDLTHCEEVLSQLDAAFYQNVFGLRTKHKNRDRTYYLVAETEADMNEWVNSLCFVLGMKENGIQDSIPPSPGAMQPPMRMSLPTPPSTSLFNSAPTLPPPRSDTLPFSNRTGKRILSHTRVQSLPGINETTNIEAEEWPPTNGRPGPRTAPPLVGSRDNHLTLRFVPPPPSVGGIQRHSCILSTIPDRPQVFEDRPLSEANSSSVEISTDYDHPRQSYYHKIPTADAGNGDSSVQFVPPDGFYNVPNRSMVRRSDQDCLYKIPPRRPRITFSDHVRYDVPASVRQSYDVPAKCTGQHTSNGEHYDVPPPGSPVPFVPPRQRSEAGDRNSDESVDILESSQLLSVLQNLINELPTLSDMSRGGDSDRIPKPPECSNWDFQPSDPLDGKISSRELLSLSPPVAGCASDVLHQHSYVNAGTTTVNGSSSLDNNRRAGDREDAGQVKLTRHHPAYNLVPTANDPICFTHRSRSFKRTPGSSQTDPLCLPVKRNSNLDETSSISDDDDDACSSSNTDCSQDPSSHKPSIYDIVPLPSRKDLGGSATAAKDVEVIKYLDLDLDASPVPEKSPGFGKSFEPLENARGVHYKEIDWCKTKALTETRREVENNRRSGERTLGD